MKKIKILGLILITMVLSGCNQGGANERFTDEFTTFDTFVSVQVFTRNEGEARVYLEQARNLFDHYHRLFDAFQGYDGINNVYTINQNAGVAPVSVDPTLFEAIERSVALYNQGLTKTNITLRPITVLYAERYNAYADGATNIENPTQEELDAANKCVGMDNIVLDASRHTVFLKNECNEIDLGAIAKGFVTDLIARRLEEDGLVHGLINAGGNVAAIGNHPDNRPFNIGIANPDDPTAHNITIRIESTNVVTSGDYQRYYMVDGVRMHHLIDPDTLKPGRYNRSVTIIHPDGLFADYVSTDTFLLPYEQIHALSQQLNFSYIVIQADGTVHVSEDIQDAVEIE